MSNSFSNIALGPSLQKAVADMGYSEMTPIQVQSIPIVLAGRDVMGAAQTGTGKTAAFTLPLLQKMLRHENASASPARHPVRALVLLPTRELACQVAQSVEDYSKYTQLRAACVYGGVDIKPQAEKLKAGVEVLIATPGRLLDHIEAKNCVLNQVEYVVLDEADRMLDIGFLPDLERILSFLPAKRQTLLFSATFSKEIRGLAQSYLTQPEVIEVAGSNEAAVNIKQRMVEVTEKNKRAALVKLVQDEKIKQAIIFANSRMGVARLARALERDGFITAALHGDKTQDERTKSLAALKEGRVQLLVATDVAARGLDVVDLPAVFNFDLPYNAEDYVHRIGRTGRAGAKGVAISFVEPRQKKLLADIEKLLKIKFELEQVDVDDSKTQRGHQSASQPRGRRDDQDGGQRDERQARPPAQNVRDSRARKPQDFDDGYSRGRHTRYDPLFSRPYDEGKATSDAKSRDDAKNKTAQSTPFSRYKNQKQAPLAVLLGGDGRYSV